MQDESESDAEITTNIVGAYAINVLLFVHMRRLYNLATPWCRMSAEGKIDVFQDSLYANRVSDIPPLAMELDELHRAVIASVDAIWINSSANKRFRTVLSICKMKQYETTKELVTSMFNTPLLRRFQEPCKKCKDVHTELYMQVFKRVDRLWTCPCKQ